MTEATIFVAEAAPAGAPVDGPLVKAGGPFSYVHWGPVIAGAVVAAAAFSVLMAFASAIGLAVASPSPTWRDTSVGLTVLSAAWTVLVAIGSFGLGGYIAGRVRSSWQTTADEVHFRDGLHGLLVWGLAVIVAAVLTGLTALTLSAATRGTTTTANSATNEPSFLTYELDRLFRAEKRPEGADDQARAEAGRIIQTGLGRRNIAADDRAYLSRLVATRTGLPAADADRRVQQVVTESRDAASRARRSGVIMGFTLAASLAAAAAAAWGAALAGGRHRDQDISPPLRHSWGTRPSF